MYIIIEELSSLTNKVARMILVCASSQNKFHGSSHVVPCRGHARNFWTCAKKENACSIKVTLVHTIVGVHVKFNSISTRFAAIVLRAQRGELAKNSSDSATRSRHRRDSFLFFFFFFYIFPRDCGTLRKKHVKSVRSRDRFHRARRHPLRESRSLSVVNLSM